MRNGSLDALRALAVMLVVVAHAGVDIFPGGFGVTLFFVISGYVITSLLLREFVLTRRFSLKKFAARRALKILPPLLLVVLLPSLLFTSQFNISLAAVAQQLLFTYNWHKMNVGAVDVFPGSGVVWSLSIEEQFYIVIAFSWLIISRVRHALRLLTGLLLTAYVASTLARFYFHAIGIYPHDDTGNMPRIYYGTDTRMSSIAIGGLLAIALQSAQSTNQLALFVSRVSKMEFATWAALGAILVSLLIRDLSFRDTLRFTVQEISSALLVATAATRAWPRWMLRFGNSSLVQRIGLASYSIYLTHLSIISLVEPNFQVERFVKIPVFVLLALLAGLVTHELADAPFETLRRRFRTQGVALSSEAESSAD